MTMCAGAETAEHFLLEDMR